MFSIFKSASNYSKKKIVNKMIHDTVHKSSFLGKELSYVAEKNDYKLIDITQEFPDSLLVNSGYCVFVNKEKKDYYLVKNNFIVFFGHYCLSDRDKKLDLDIISKDFLKYNFMIKAFTLYCLAYIDEYKKYLNNYSSEIFKDVFLEIDQIETNKEGFSVTYK